MTQLMFNDCHYEIRKAEGYFVLRCLSMFHRVSGIYEINRIFLSKQWEGGDTCNLNKGNSKT